MFSFSLTPSIPPGTGPLALATDAAGFVPGGSAAIGTISGLIHSRDSGVGAGVAPWPPGKGNATDQARSARADSYLVGALHGDVTSARLALGAKQTNTSKAEQALYSQILGTIASKAPDVYAAAIAAGPLHDGADGYQGLQELWALQVPFTDPWAGHSTSDHSDLKTGAVALAAQLAGLSSAMNTPGVTGAVAGVMPTVAPGGVHPTVAAGLGAGGTNAVVAILAIGGALLFATRKRR